MLARKGGRDREGTVERRRTLGKSLACDMCGSTDGLGLPEYSVR